MIGSSISVWPNWPNQWHYCHQPDRWQPTSQLAANQTDGSQPASWDSPFLFYFRFWSIRSGLNVYCIKSRQSCFHDPVSQPLQGQCHEIFTLPHQFFSLNIVPWLSFCWIIFEYGLNFADIFVTCFWLRGIYNIYSKMLLNLCSPSTVLHYFLYSFLCDYPFKSHTKTSVSEITPKTWTLQKHRIKNDIFYVIIILKKNTFWNSITNDKIEILLWEIKTIFKIILALECVRIMIKTKVKNLVTLSL